MSVKQQGSIKQNYKLKELRVDVYFEMSQLISLTSISFFFLEAICHPGDI